MMTVNFSVVWVENYDFKNYVHLSSHPRRDDLYYPTWCGYDLSVKKFCVRCYSIPKWMIPSYYLPASFDVLDLEYTSPTGIGKVIKRSINTPVEYISVVHIKGYLSSIPSNLGDFEKIGYIDFSFNQINKIEHIEHLHFLDTLVLKGILISCFAICALTAFKFRQELFIVYREMPHFTRHRKIRVIPEIIMNSVYISFDNDDRQLLNWVTCVLVPLLESRSFKVFIFMRDSYAGESYEDEIRKLISKSNNYNHSE
ncbi:unnamed protein product [Mytilus coruscus]|uniref:TIR domain-containing protein n=1 Tax=Mytilus coruscus TaxID=42192 RepID=A0A6J8DS66_MYTCO|nr:unnamed protein product [Mytilus coruscus]